MKRKILALAAGIGAAIILAPAASAQLYGGVGYTVFQADVGSEDASLGTIMGRLGYKTSPILAFEGEASIGVQDESFDVLGTTVDVGIENQYASAGGLGSASEDGSGLAYGAGVMLNFIPFTKLRLDYTRYEADDGEFDSLGLSGLFTF
jgi:hypothetical protein